MWKSCRLLGSLIVLFSGIAASANVEVPVLSGTVKSPARIVTEDGLKVVKFPDENAGSIAFVFSVPATGNYALESFVASPNTSSDSVFFSIDGLSKITWHFTQNKEFHLERFRTEVRLAAGKHKLVIYGREPNVRISAVRLQGSSTDVTPLPSPSPTPTPTVAPTPVVSIVSPVSQSFVNASNVKSVNVSGKCSEVDSVLVSAGLLSTSTICSSGSWSAALDLTNVADGVVQLNARGANQSSSSATVGVEVQKDTVAPVVGIASPVSGSVVGAVLKVAGSCSEEGRAVIVTGDVGSQAVCSGNKWSADLDLSSIAGGKSIALIYTQKDLAGNSASGTLNLVKISDPVTVPPVAGMIVPAPSYLDNVDSATQVSVAASSVTDAASRAASAAANTRIVISKGTFSGLNLTITGKGSARKPIIIEGQADGSTILTGKNNLIVKGSYILLKNLHFVDYDSNNYGGGSSVIAFDACEYCGIYYSKMENSVAPVMSSGNDARHFKSILIKANSQSVEVGHCSFISKKNAGSVVLINRDVNRVNLYEGHRIFSNLFSGRELQGDDANDFDSIRIGDSATSQTPSHANAEKLMSLSPAVMVGNTVEFNIIENTQITPARYETCKASNTWSSSSCSGEPEIISVKAPQTVVRFNTFRNNSGGITLRHGYMSIVEGNYMSGNNAPQGINAIMPASYGVRVIGDSHLIMNNHFENLSSPSQLQAGISILPGQPNAALNGYWEVYDTVISMNFLLNVSSKPISFASDYGGRSKTVLPVGIGFSNNIVSGGSQAIFNQGPSLDYLISGFNFSGNLYDSTNLGVSIAAASKISSVVTSEMNGSGFHIPSGADYVGSAGRLAASSGKIYEISTGLSKVTSSASVARIERLMGFLKIKNGTLYENVPPLRKNAIGSSF